MGVGEEKGESLARVPTSLGHKDHKPCGVSLTSL